MAVGFPKPRFQYDYELEQEKSNFDRFFANPEKPMPAKKADEIDLATWNIANLGLQKRRDTDLALIAHILTYFDIIAVQEVNSDLGHFNRIMDILRDEGFDMMLTDTTGSQERLVVIYRTARLEPRQLFGELDYNPNGKIVNGNYVILPKKQSFTLNGKKIITHFYNFNRNPYLTTWRVIGSDTSFMLANVHIYYGDDKQDSAKIKNRIAEVYYLANWAKEQKKKAKNRLYESNIILIGDMNIPKMKSNDTVYRALTRRGMQPSKYSTQAGTTIKEFSTYDQVVFTNNNLEVKKINNHKATVVDFDNYIFSDLWEKVTTGERTLQQFKAWTRFAVSDHRPLFVRLKI